MNLEEWRKLQQGGEDATLPSGLVVQIKRVGVLELAEQGKIPQTLAPQLEQFMRGRAQQAASLDDFQEYSEVITLVCRACIVGPAGLDIVELPYTDRLAIFQWANEVGKPLATFRSQSNGAVEAPFSVG